MIQCSTKFVVGTSTMLPANVLNGYLPGPSGRSQTPRFAFGHALAVAERRARKVLAHAAVVADHDADIADRHDGLRNQLDRGEPAVDEVRAVGERHILPAAAAAGPQERFGVLIVVVIVLFGRSVPTAGAMISPGASDGPSCTVTMPMLSTSRHFVSPSNPARCIGRTDHDRVEPVDFEQLFVPLSNAVRFLPIQHVPQRRALCSR